MTSTGKNPFLMINETPVYFEENWNTGIGGGLWSTGYAMAKYMENNASHVRENLCALRSKSLSVLEVGSGNGFLSVCILALARDLLSHLVITDRSDHLELIRRTLQANEHINQDSVLLMEHDWGSFGEKDDTTQTLKARVEQGTIKFDLIVGSDVAYHEDLYDILIASLSRFSHKKTISLIGVTMKDTKPQFFQKLQLGGFKYERLADHLHPMEFRGPIFGIFVIRRQEDR